MTNALAKLDSSSWGVLKEQASILLQSGFLPNSIKTPENALAIMMLGQELGIGAWAALSTINVIQNKPTISPQLMLALINASGQLEDIAIESDDNGASCTMKRARRTPHTETFTRQDAAAMQLIGKDNYKKQPATMMKWRAVAACARVVFPDVVLGLYTPDEMGADTITDEQGNMTVVTVEREPLQIEAARPTPPSSSPPAAQNGGSADGDWTIADLWNTAGTFFKNRPHFNNWWAKHMTEYTGKPFADIVDDITWRNWYYDRDTVTRFFADAETELNMSSADVKEALSNAAGKAIKSLSNDWHSDDDARRDVDYARAALLAWRGGYSDKDIRAEAKRLDVDAVLMDIALDIALAYSLQAKEVANV